MLQILSNVCKGHSLICDNLLEGDTRCSKRGALKAATRGAFEAAEEEQLTQQLTMMNMAASHSNQHDRLEGQPLLASALLMN